MSTFARIRCAILRAEARALQVINRKLATKLAVDNARARGEITRLEEQFTALAKDFHGTAGNPHPSLPVRIHRILAGIQ